MGLERSIPLANARRDLETARSQIKSVRAQALPSLNMDARYSRLDDVPTFPEIPGISEGMPTSIGRRDQTVATLTAEQLLYSGGAVRTALSIAKDYEEAAVYELERATSDLIRRIIRGFHEVLYYQEAYSVAQDSLKQLVEFEAQARKRYQTNTASEFEWLTAQVNVTNERPSLLAAKNALDLSQRSFRDLIMLDEESDFALDGSLEIELELPDLQTLQENALADRPALRQAQAEYRVALQTKRITLSEYRPELHVFASYGGSDPSQRDFFSEGWQWEWMAGVRLSWSFFDGGRRRAELEQNNLAIDRIRDTIEDMERATLLEVEQLWLTLQELFAVLEGTMEGIRLAERALNIANVRYTQGLATNLDFSNSLLAFNEARLNHQQALLRVHQTWADLRHVAALYPLSIKGDHL